MYFYVPYACVADLKLRGGNPNDKSLDLLSVGSNSATISLSAVPLLVAPLVYIMWHKTWTIIQPMQSKTRTSS
ncbi:hypothetical protein Cfor_12279 [Coptotermes formosanus]|uniref:Uncharacterized protein n=1 Tax=Coptotermes formosanus TaxID=36987 RepID=A0A6L2PNV2_COPFO|nr:hypothetical protein Cfor_12279 [Coptotermes formosanus]